MSARNLLIGAMLDCIDDNMLAAHHADVERMADEAIAAVTPLLSEETTRLRAELAAARNEIARLATQAAAMRDALLATGRTYSGVIPPLPPMPTGDAP